MKVLPLSDFLADPEKILVATESGGQPLLLSRTDELAFAILPMQSIDLGQTLIPFLAGSAVDKPPQAKTLAEIVAELERRSITP